MTDKELFKYVRGLGLVIGKYEGEYFVSFRAADGGADENSMYFTNDKLDALGTARLMAEDFKRIRERNPSRRSIHSAKFDRCVKKVKRSSPHVNAYAVCTNSLGEAAFKPSHRRRGPWPRGKVPPHLRKFLFKRSKRR